MIAGSPDTYIGCTILSRSEVNPLSITDRYVEIVLTPNSQLQSATLYALVITTAYPLSNGSKMVYGLNFPSSPYTYKLELSLWSSYPLLPNELEWVTVYYQVYGVAFTSIEAISYVTIPGEWNIFTVKFTSNGAID